MAFDTVYCAVCGLEVQRLFFGRKGKTTYNGTEWARRCKLIVPGKPMPAGECEHLTKAIISPGPTR
jgi:hypothetical protein